MGSKEGNLKKIVDIIIAVNIPAIEAAGKVVLDSGIDPQVILEEGGSKGLDVVGEKFENLELFLPECLPLPKP